MKLTKINAGLVFCLSVFLLSPSVIFAQEYQPIVGIPGVEDAGDLNAYINALYALSISLAALIAVVKIVIAGAKYMLSDLISSKSDAKDDIWNALIGLLIILSAWLILNTINSDIVGMELFRDPVTVPSTQDQNTNSPDDYSGAPDTTNEDLANALSQQEYVQIAEAAGLEVQSAVVSKICEDYSFTYTTAECNQQEGENFCIDDLNGFVNGSACIFVTDNLHSYIYESVYTTYTETCAELNNGECSFVSCTTVDVSSFSSCDTECSNINGIYVEYPNGLEDRCAVAAENVESISIDTNTIYYTGTLDDPVVIEFVDTENAINGYVSVLYSESWTFKYDLIPCDEVYINQSGTLVPANLCNN